MPAKPARFRLKAATIIHVEVMSLSVAKVISHPLAPSPVALSAVVSIEPELHRLES
jgi:hypothetical protein